MASEKQPFYPWLGQFEWVVGPMGSPRCPVPFQRLVKFALSSLVNIIVYIDDLLLHSKTHNNHLHQLDKLLSRFRNVGLKAKLPKCNFGANIVQYPVFRLT
jgi:hypothetical protein